ncbi:hypothetical protein V502_04768 [Pseudogymnoascus sp. VKM F-4520 (FW-2644)]|nr:hypothetical protein V502_04768 [Pseudogymnoascus sp. VKM F-4520 (FW-2644)]
MDKADERVHTSRVLHRNNESGDSIPTTTTGLVDNENASRELAFMAQKTYANVASSAKNGRRRKGTLKMLDLDYSAMSENALDLKRKFVSWGVNCAARSSTASTRESGESEGKATGDEESENEAEDPSELDKRIWTFQKTAQTELDAMPTNNTDKVFELVYTSRSRSKISVEMIYVSGGLVFICVFV